MVKIPTFRYMGGKARIRSWVVDKFPKSGNTYVEPFCGAGNVFYLVKSKLNFREYWLNDKYSSLAASILNLEPSSLPEKVDRSLFTQLRERAKLYDSLALVLEPRITFAGKGYAAGFQKDDLSDYARYSKENYLPVLEAAKNLLSDVKITSLEWKEVFDSLSADTFVYCDPPYFGTKASYPNIDHEMLVDVLNSAKYRWALSGYDNALYDANLQFKNKYQIERNSEIKSSVERRKVPVVETLWTNY